MWLTNKDQVQPPPKKIKKMRLEKGDRRSETEEQPKKSRHYIVVCRNCGQLGHNTIGCKQPSSYLNKRKRNQVINY